MEDLLLKLNVVKNVNYIKELENKNNLYQVKFKNYTLKSKKEFITL